MAAEQLIYTSCRTGINNQGSGFQVYSHSKGLDTFQVTNIQRFACQYKEPHTLPSMPSANEISDLFPISFSLTKLDEQNSCLSQAAYLGRDYMGESGRYGNYISHVVIINKDWLELYPIELYGSDLFIKKLRAEQVNSTEIPGQLPSINRKALSDTLGSTVNFYSVKDFLSRDPDRIEILKQMLFAAINAKSRGKKLLICDSNENILQWIGAITMSFPLCSAKNISFNTYAYDPENNDALICGVFPDGTVYNPHVASSSGLFYVFDFVNDVFASDQPNSKFVDLAGIGFEFSKESLDFFHDFIAKVNYCSVDANIDAVYSLYLIYNGDFEDLTLAELSRALLFAEKNCDNEVIKIIYNAIKSNIDNFILNADFDTAFALYKFLYSSSLKLKETDIASFAMSVFYSCLLDFVNDYKVYTPKAISDFYTSVMKEFPGQSALLQRHLFSREVIAEVILSLTGDTDLYHNTFYFNLVVDYLIENRLSLSTFAAKHKMDIIERICGNLSVMKEQDALNCASLMLQRLRNHKDLSFEFYQLFLESFAGKEHALLMYTENYCMDEAMENDCAEKVGRHLLYKKLYLTAYALYKKMLGATGDNKQYFINYYKAAIKYPEYHKQYGDQLILDYIEKIAALNNDVKMNNELKMILDSYLTDINSAEIAEAIIVKYADGLSLGLPDSSIVSTIFTLCDYCGKHGIVFSPDRISVLCFSWNIYELCKKGNHEKFINYFRGLNSNMFSSLGRNEQKKLLDWLLPAMASIVEDEDDHSLVFFVFSAFPQDYLAKKYFSDFLKNTKRRGEDAAYIGIFAFIAKNPKAPDVVVDILYKGVFDWIYGVSDKTLDALTILVSRNYDSGVQKSWQELLKERQNKKENSLLGKAKNLFNKGKR